MNDEIALLLISLGVLVLFIRALYNKCIVTEVKCDPDPENND